VFRFVSGQFNQPFFRFANCSSKFRLNCEIKYKLSFIGSNDYENLESFILGDLQTSETLPL
jgi:hypothetical protein